MIYTYRCKGCRMTTDASRLMEHRHNSPDCEHCGAETRLIITPTMHQAVMGAADCPGYMCPVTDQWVDSKRKRRNIMAEHAMEEAG